MAHLINKKISWDNKTYILISYNEALDMFIGREVNRQFTTLIPAELALS